MRCVNFPPITSGFYIRKSCLFTPQIFSVFPAISPTCEMIICAGQRVLDRIEWIYCGRDTYLSERYFGKTNIWAARDWIAMIKFLGNYSYILCVNTLLSLRTCIGQYMTHSVTKTSILKSHKFAVSLTKQQNFVCNFLESSLKWFLL